MQANSHFSNFDFDKIKKTNWGVIGLVVLVDAALLVVAMLVILPIFQESFPIERFTNGIIKATLIFSLVRFFLVISGIAIWVGGLTWSDLGLYKKKFYRGTIVVFCLWILMQLIGMLLHLFTSGKVGLSPIWTLEKIPLIAGELIAQFLGNAFAEEIILRGFLLTQVILLLKRKISNRGRLLTASILISQLIFALTHIPQRIATGYTVPSLVVNLFLLWVIGSLFAVLYLRTENIFIVIGLHALANVPVSILAIPSQATGELLIYLLTLGLIFTWRPLVYRFIYPDRPSN